MKENGGNSIKTSRAPISTYDPHLSHAGLHSRQIILHALRPLSDLYSLHLGQYLLIQSPETDLPVGIINLAHAEISDTEIMVHTASTILVLASCGCEAQIQNSIFDKGLGLKVRFFMGANVS